MKDCPYCNIEKCPVINTTQCPIKALWDRVEQMEKQAKDIDNRHVVNLGRVSRN